MYMKLAWILAAGLALGATAEAQTVKGLLDKAGSSASAVSGNTGPATESEVDSLADKVAACNKLDTQGMIDCATGLAPVAADLARYRGSLGVEQAVQPAHGQSGCPGNAVPVKVRIGQMVGNEGARTQQCLAVGIGKLGPGTGFGRKAGGAGQKINADDANGIDRRQCEAVKLIAFGDKRQCDRRYREQREQQVRQSATHAR